MRGDPYTFSRAAAWPLLLVAAGATGAGCARVGYNGSAPRDLGLEVGSPWPGFSVLGFRGQWATPQAVSWVWQCQGSILDFVAISLCVTDDPVVLRAGRVTCLGAADAFGLGQLECMGDPWWVTATSYSLQPLSTYHAEIHFGDSHGNVARSAPASQSTPAVPASREVIFGDALPVGASLKGMSLSSANPQAGSQGLVSEHADNSPHTLELSGFGLSLPGLDEARLRAGHLEFLLDLPRAAGVSVKLASAGRLFVFTKPYGYATPDAKPGYQRIQVPLRQFVLDGTTQPITLAELKAVTGLSLVAVWGTGEVLLDEISIWYWRPVTTGRDSRPVKYPEHPPLLGGVPPIATGGFGMSNRHLERRRSFSRTPSGAFETPEARR